MRDLEFTIQDELIGLAKGIEENATDTVWFSKSETAQDKIFKIYESCGLDMEILQGNFPHVFDKD